MPDRPHRRVQNYTSPFLAMTGLILFFGLWTLAALAGPLWALATALALDRLIAALRR